MALSKPLSYVLMAHESCKSISNDLWPSKNPLGHLLILREGSLFMGWGQDPGGVSEIRLPAKGRGQTNLDFSRRT